MVMFKISCYYQQTELSRVFNVRILILAGSMFLSFDVTNLRVFVGQTIFT